MARPKGDVGGSVPPRGQKGQRQPALPVGPVFDPNTGSVTGQDKISQSQAPKVGPTSAAVLSRQRLLRAAGYNIRVDGIWGPRSQAAWVDYSKRRKSPFVSAADQRRVEGQQQASIEARQPIAFESREDRHSKQITIDTRIAAKEQARRERAAAIKQSKVELEQDIQRIAKLTKRVVAEPYRARNLSQRDVAAMILDRDSEAFITKPAGARIAQEWLSHNGYKVKITGKYDAQTHAALQRAEADSVKEQEKGAMKEIARSLYKPAGLTPGSKIASMPHGTVPTYREMLDIIQRGGFEASLYLKAFTDFAAQNQWYAFDTFRYAELLKLSAKLQPFGFSRLIRFLVGGNPDDLSRRELYDVAELLKNSLSGSETAMLMDILGVRDLAPTVGADPLMQGQLVGEGVFAKKDSPIFGKDERSLLDRQRDANVARAANETIQLQNARYLGRLHGNVHALMQAQSLDDFARKLTVYTRMEDQKYENLAKQIAANRIGWFGKAVEKIWHPVDIMQTGLLYYALDSMQRFDRTFDTATVGGIPIISLADGDTGGRDVQWEDAMRVLGTPKEEIPWYDDTINPANFGLRLGYQLIVDPFNFVGPFKLLSTTARFGTRLTTLGPQFAKLGGYGLRSTVESADVAVQRARWERYVNDHIKYQKGTWSKSGTLAGISDLLPGTNIEDTKAWQKMATPFRKLTDLRDDAVERVQQRLRVRTRHLFRDKARRQIPGVTDQLDLKAVKGEKATRKIQEGQTAVKGYLQKEKGYWAGMLGDLKNLRGSVYMRADLDTHSQLGIKLIARQAEEARVQVTTRKASRAAEDVYLKAMADANVERAAILERFGLTEDDMYNAVEEGIDLSEVGPRLSEWNERWKDVRAAAFQDSLDEYDNFVRRSGAFIAGGGDKALMDEIATEVSMLTREFEDVWLPVIHDILEDAADAGGYSLWDEKGLWVQREGEWTSWLDEQVHRSFDEDALVTIPNGQFGIPHNDVEMSQAIEREVARRHSRVMGYAERIAVGELGKKFDTLTHLEDIRAAVEDSWKMGADGKWYDQREVLRVSDLYVRHLASAMAPMLRGREWASRTQAVDSAGNPRIFYHGTTSTFDQWREPELGAAHSRMGPGIYFAARPQTASLYSRGLTSGDAEFQTIYLGRMNRVWDERSGGVVDVEWTPESLQEEIDRIAAERPVSHAEVKFDIEGPYIKVQYYGDAANVHPVFLDIRNPFRPDIPLDNVDTEWLDKIINAVASRVSARGGDGEAMKNEAWATFNRFKDTQDEEPFAKTMHFLMPSNPVNAVAERRTGRKLLETYTAADFYLALSDLGYDGIHHYDSFFRMTDEWNELESEVWIAFKPEQIHRFSEVSDPLSWEVPQPRAAADFVGRDKNWVFYGDPDVRAFDRPSMFPGGDRAGIRLTQAESASNGTRHLVPPAAFDGALPLDATMKASRQNKIWKYVRSQGVEGMRITEGATVRQVMSHLAEIAEEHGVAVGWSMERTDAFVRRALTQGDMTGFQSVNGKGERIFTLFPESKVVEGIKLLTESAGKDRGIPDAYRAELNEIQQLAVPPLLTAQFGGGFDQAIGQLVWDMGGRGRRPDIDGWQWDAAARRFAPTLTGETKEAREAEMQALNQEQAEVRTGVQQMLVGMRMAWDEQLPGEMFREAALWRAFHHAQSMPLKAAYLLIQGGLNLWIFATLALRPAWTVRNVIDNTVKLLISGVRDPRMFVLGAAKPGQTVGKVKTVFDAQLDVVMAMTKFLDKLFGTQVSVGLQRVYDSFWEMTDEAIKGVFHMYNLPVDEIAIQRTKIDPFDRRRGVRRPDVRKFSKEIDTLDPEIEKEVARYTRDRTDNVWERFRNGAFTLLGDRPENWFKRVIYRDTYRKSLERNLAEGMDDIAARQLAAEEAWKDVEKVLFNYDKITVIEDNLRVFFPFIQFWRKNTTFWLREFADKPWLPASVLMWEHEMNEQHVDLPQWMRRYLHVDELVDAAAVVPGLDVVVQAMLPSEAMYDPLNFLSIAPLYRAVKGNNPNLPANEMGNRIFAPIVDALNEYGLGLNPFMRKPMEAFGLANQRSWQYVFPQTPILVALTSEYLSTELSLDVAQWESLWGLLPLGVQPNEIADSFNEYVQMEMAGQAEREEPINRERAEKVIKAWFLYQNLWSYFGGVYWRRATQSDIYLSTLYDDVLTGEIEFDDLTPKQERLFNLWRMRGADRLSFSRYVTMYPKIEAYYRQGSYEDAQAYLAENPDLVQYVSPAWRGKPWSVKYVQSATKYADSDTYARVQRLLDVSGPPPDEDPEGFRQLKAAARTLYVTPEMQAYWSKARSNTREKDLMVQAEINRQMFRLNETFFAIPEKDHEARDGFIDEHPELERWWQRDNTAADDYHAILGAANADLRKAYFHIRDTKGWDEAAPFLKAFPFIFEDTTAADRVKDGQWIPGGVNSAHGRAYLSALPYLKRFFALLRRVGKDKAFDWLYSSDSEDAKIVKDYFAKWGKGRGGKRSQHAIDYLQAKPHLQVYFDMPEDVRGDWLRGPSEGARIVREYFDKYADPKGLTQHARDYLAIRGLLDAYFAMSKKERGEWLRSGSPEAQKVLEYFKKYSKTHQWERSVSKLDPGLLDGDPSLMRRLDFWQQYFALPPDQRPAFVHRYAEQYGLFVYGVHGEQERFDAEQEWMRRAIGAGASKRQADFLYVKPLMDFYRTITDPDEKQLFLKLNPELKEYFDRYVQNSLTGDAKLDKLVERYFGLPENSPARSVFLRQHPEVQDYFDEKSTPAERAIRALLEQYFSKVSAADRLAFREAHPELGVYFEQRREERSREKEQLGAFDAADPRLTGYFEDAKDAIRAAETMRRKLAEQALRSFRPEGVETRRERRKIADHPA